MAKSKKRSAPAASPVDARPADVDNDGGATRARIAMRAYELYLARGGRNGSDFDDWIAAERELSRSGPLIGSDRSK
jgi:hypothetical protein